MSKTTSEAADRIKELQSALKAKVAANKEVAEAYKMEGDTLLVTPEQKSAFEANMKDIREINALLADFKTVASIEDELNAPASDSAAMEAMITESRSGAQAKSLGQQFVESEEFKALDQGRNGYVMRTPFERKLADMGSYYKDVYAGTPAAVGDFTAQNIQRDGFVNRNRRLARVRDLFPVQTTTSPVIEFYRVGGFVNNASTVPQYSGGNFGLKPQSELTFSGEQASVRTIAHWEAAHRSVLADEPQLRGIIDSELLYGLALVEDAQILAGDGTGENLLGILNTPGIQQYSWSTGATTPVPDTKADAIRRAATLAFLAQYEPTGVVVHPNDWEDIELTKATTGEYLLAVSIALGGEKRVWRMPVIDSPAIQEGTALVGAFGVGAQIYDREQANIRIAEQHGDFFIRNAIVILAEERLALATKRPESFVEVTFDAEPS